MSSFMGEPFTMWYGWRTVMGTRSRAVCDVYSMVVGETVWPVVGMAVNPVEAVWGRGKMSLETSTGAKSVPAPPCVLPGDD